MRSILAWKLPLATSAQLKDVPLAGKKARTTFTLEDVAAFRGSTVDALISQSVDVYLERSNFNDPGEVEGALARVGLPTTARRVPGQARAHDEAKALGV